MFHRATTEWPCLSIDFLAESQDSSKIMLRDFRVPTNNIKYPLDVYVVGGSQAETANQNSIYVMKFTDLGLTKYDDDEDLNQSFEDIEPKLYYQKISTSAGTNRLKTLNHSPIVGLLNENAQLQIIDIRQDFEILKNKGPKDSLESKGSFNIIKQFLLSDEGFGLDFSPLDLAKLACGTNNGEINIFQPTDENISDITKSPSSININNKSIEDLQFSPKEPHVLASCSTDGTIKVFDLRTPFKNISHLNIKAHETDVNVISWNKNATNLIASGADDGSFKVWDLRYVDKPPISHIGWHVAPITSIEWQPHDEWTISVASSDNRLSLWDFSVEPDDSEIDYNLKNNIPDQLLFLHQGQEDLKECKWHPVYKNVMISTALDGYNVFQPALDGDLSSLDSVDSPNDMEEENFN